MGLFSLIKEKLWGMFLFAYGADKDAHSDTYIPPYLTNLFIGPFGERVSPFPSLSLFPGLLITKKSLAVSPSDTLVKRVDEGNAWGGMFRYFSPQ